METMKQGVVLMGEEDGQILFFNSAANDLIKQAIASRPETQEIFDQYIAFNGLDPLNEKIDFVDSQFMDLKMFDKKINEEEAAFGRRHSTSSGNNGRFSFHDLIILNKKDLAHQIFMLQPTETKESIYFCLQVSTIFQEN